MKTTKIVAAVAVGAAGALLAVAPAQAAPVRASASVRHAQCFIGRPVPRPVWIPGVGFLPRPVEQCSGFRPDRWR